VSTKYRYTSFLSSKYVEHEHVKKRSNKVQIRWNTLRLSIADGGCRQSCWQNLTFRKSKSTVRWTVLSTCLKTLIFKKTLLTVQRRVSTGQVFLALPAGCLVSWSPRSVLLGAWPIIQFNCHLGPNDKSKYYPNCIYTMIRSTISSKVNHWFGGEGMEACKHLVTSVLGSIWKLGSNVLPDTSPWAFNRNYHVTWKQAQPL